MCKETNCERRVYAKGQCKRHYSRDLRLRQPACTEPDCTRPKLASNGLCAKHYWKTDEGYNYKLRAFYGITIEDYNQMLTDQQGVCAICKGTEPDNRRQRLCVDHDHETGAVRGLLCSACNKALGLFQDSEAFLSAAINYLKK